MMILTPPNNNIIQEEVAEAVREVVVGVEVQLAAQLTTIILTPQTMTTVVGINNNNNTTASNIRSLDLTNQDIKSRLRSIRLTHLKERSLFCMMNQLIINIEAGIIINLREVLSSLVEVEEAAVAVTAVVPTESRLPQITSKRGNMKEICSRGKSNMHLATLRKACWQQVQRKFSRIPTISVCGVVRWITGRDRHSDSLKAWALQLIIWVVEKTLNTYPRGRKRFL